ARHGPGALRHPARLHRRAGMVRSPPPPPPRPAPAGGLPLSRSHCRSRMTDKVRPYLYYDVALALCSRCLRKVEGKVLFQDGKVYLDKRCPDHGRERVLVADDVEYYKRCREVFIK